MRTPISSGETVSARCPTPRSYSSAVPCGLGGPWRLLSPTSFTECRPASQTCEIISAKYTAAYVLGQRLHLMRALVARDGMFQPSQGTRSEMSDRRTALVAVLTKYLISRSESASELPQSLLEKKNPKAALNPRCRRIEFDLMRRRDATKSPALCLVLRCRMKRAQHVQIRLANEGTSEIM
jgi:hypothetical protein